MTASVSVTAKELRVSQGTVAVVRKALVKEGLRPAARNSPAVGTAVADEPDREGGMELNADALEEEKLELALVATLPDVPDAVLARLLIAILEVIDARIEERLSTEPETAE
jgi:hypothetical protein